MTAYITQEFLDDQATAIKAAITALQTAQTALLSGAQSYTLDTGANRQTVTRANLSDIRLQLQELYNTLSTLEARSCGASHYGRPSW